VRAGHAAVIAVVAGDQVITPQSPIARGAFIINLHQRAWTILKKNRLNSGPTAFGSVPDHLYATNSSVDGIS
jgi:hypothetical protein